MGDSQHCSLKCGESVTLKSDLKRPYGAELLSCGIGEGLHGS